MRLRVQLTGTRTRLREESGQVFAFVAIAIVVLLAMTAFVVDVGYAWYVKRSLQASADAAATAGALELPDPDRAIAVAREYSGSEGARNERGNVPDVRTAVSTKCLRFAPCAPVNAIVVRQTTEVKTFFARVVGIDSYTVSAKATACSPCSSRELDVMLVLDRTGSMCQTSSGASDPSCTDLNNARRGMRTFLQFMDPSLHLVGFAVFPPATGAAARCDLPKTSNYDSRPSPYAIVPLSSDYKVNGALNESSALVSTINCQRGGGRTAYATAMEHTQAELDAHGRPGVQDVIVFLSDGAANYGPAYYPNGSPYQTQPCHQGIVAAAGAKANGTLVYAIGYDLDAQGGTANICQANTAGQPREQPPITASETLQQMASGPSAFYNQPNPGQLNSIYASIAADVSGTRLIDDDLE